ncbi:MAG: tetratricopeptide repeat protein [Cytophagales bacterium]|nr:tetratricopeptide repeat protein [Cytophagales bacterium]
MIQTALLSFLLLTFGVDDLTKISKANKAKQEAEAFFKAKKFDRAVSKYKYLVDTLKVADDNVLLNLAHSLYRSEDKPAAEKIYKSLFSSTNPTIRSISQLQCGNVAAEAGNNEDALNHYKNALKADPSNAEARYNYELLKKQEKKNDPNKDQKQNKDNQQKKDQDKKDQKNDGQNKDQKNDGKNGQDKDNKDNQSGKDKNGKDKEGDKGDQKDDAQSKGNKKDGKDGKDGKDKGDKGDKKDDDKGKNGSNPEDKKGDQKNPEDKDGQANKPGGKPENKDGQANADKKSDKKGKNDATQMDVGRLQQMNLTPDKAKMILEAMRNTEVQYLQQMQKQPTKRTDRSKPTW